MKETPRSPHRRRAALAAANLILSLLGATACHGEVKGSFTAPAGALGGDMGDHSGAEDFVRTWETSEYLGAH